jgi:hypothetical protein
VAALSSPTSEPHHHSLLGKVAHGVGDFTGNLLGRRAGHGGRPPDRLRHARAHPIRSIELMGKTTWKDWSPLFHGHVGEFAHNFYAHPLAPILDIAGLVTGGAGLAAAAEEGLGELGAISKESRLATLGRGVSEEVKVPGAPAAFRHFDKNPVVRLRQRAGVSLGHKLSEAAPSWFGRTATSRIPSGSSSASSPAAASAQALPSTALDKVREIQKGGSATSPTRASSTATCKKQESYRSGATRAMVGAQLATFVKSGEDLTKRPARSPAKIERHGSEQLMLDHAYRVSHGGREAAQDRASSSCAGDPRTRWARPQSRGLREGDGAVRLAAHDARHQPGGARDCERRLPRRPQARGDQLRQGGREQRDLPRQALQVPDVDVEVRRSWPRGRRTS